ncbi:hypothetical protein Q3G72_031972 [Acer saccharum]|nr:hypothetical protein Q3G72_031972 [Acer saccharum]
MVASVYEILVNYVEVIDAPPIPNSEEELGRTHALKVQNEQDYLCHGKICSRLEDNLFDIYYQIPSAHDMWYALEKKYNKKYNTKDVGLVGGDSTASEGGYVSYFPKVNMVYQSDE